MKKTILALSLILGCLTFSTAQSSLNDYKYVIVPNSYDFLKSNDQYQLNSLTKFLFNKYGFIALMENENFPEDLAKNVCMALHSDVEKISSFLKTKLKVVLKNCKGEIIYTSQVGETKEKDYNKAYNLALRDAFKSFKTINYSYKPNKNSVAQSSTINTETNQEIKKLKQEIKTLKDKKSNNEVMVEAKPEEKKEVAKAVIEKEIVKISEATSKHSNVLYAQEIENGFQLVDSSPKVVYKIKKSNLSNVFFIEGKSAILYKVDSHWVLEYYENDKLKQEILNIKF